MTTDEVAPTKYINALSEILSSLRLKDVLDAIVLQYAHLTEAGKVAVFLADNQGKAFRLMAAKGYSELSMQQMKEISFNDEGIFAEILKKRLPVVLKLGSQFSGFNKAVFERERSTNQAAFPLVAAGLIVGAIVIDSNVPILLNDSQAWESINTITALGIANAIIFGRSEYERERLNTLYKILSAFQDNALNLNQVLQKTADAALVLANTPYCAVLLHERENSSFALAAFKGFDGASLLEFDLVGSNTLAAAAFSQGQRLFAGKNGQEAGGIPKAMGGGLFRSILALPLTNEGNKIGILEVFSTDEEAFNSEQIDLLEALTNQASKAIQLAQEHESTVLQVARDPHTGLLNRFHFNSALKTEIERSNRHNHLLALLLIDIDYLSRINDRLGQEIGDETIAKIAKLIKDTLREIDLIYRFGGDQFAVILPETSRNEAEIVVNRLREKIKKIVIPNVGAITVSIGMATYPEHGKEAEEVIAVTEHALYLAKYQGRDRLVVPQVLGGQTEANSWLELAKYAKQAVSAERRERAKSHLSSSADYANWLLKIKNTVQPTPIKKDQVPFP